METSFFVKKKTKNWSLACFIEFYSTKENKIRYYRVETSFFVEKKDQKTGLQPVLSNFIFYRRIKFDKTGGRPAFLSFFRGKKEEKEGFYPVLSNSTRYIRIKFDTTGCFADRYSRE